MTWRSLEDTAISAQVLYFARQAWSDWRRGTDFYDEAALIWLEADILLREKSNGRYSLNEFARRFYGGSGGGPAVVPYTLQDIVATLTEMVPYDWNQFFEERLNSTAAAAPMGGIEGSGWRLVYRDSGPNGVSRTGNGSASADLRFSLGMSIGREGEIRDVSPNGPADAAGLAPAMRVVGVNGRKYSSDRIHDAIVEAKDSSDAIELLVENRELFETYRVDYHEGERYPSLVREPSKPDLLSDILQPLVR